MALPPVAALGSLLLLATGLPEAPIEGPAGPATSVAPTDDGTLVFLDHGVERLLVRAEPSRTDRRTQATFFDPATGRSAVVTVGNEVILVGDAAGLAYVLSTQAIERVRDLMPSRGVVLVRSARQCECEDGALLAERLAPLVRDGFLEEAYPDLSFQHAALDIAIPPSDTRYAGQYYLDEVNIEGAWALSNGDESTLIVVADNGCDLTHPDLVDKLDVGFDPFEEDDDPSWKPGDGAEHGTACAGLAAASTDNGAGIAGACPACRLACARLLPADDEVVTVSSDLLVFQFVLDSDASVTSNSWGFIDAIPVPGPLRSAIIEVQQNGRSGLGAVVVFASGNDNRLIGDDELLAVPGVLGVGAVNNLGELTQYSNYGPSVDVVAPTGSLTLDIAGAAGADPGDITDQFGGTSSAAPIVSGIAGLIASSAPDLTADEINDILMATAKQSVQAEPDETGHDDDYGFGRVQADQALEVALGLDTTPGGDDPDDPDDVLTCAHTRRQAGPPAALALLAFMALGFRRRRA